ncbi:MAG: acyloxyacyl hydrolase, partial [Burkholderiales bacterium]|nr:acyloxyacyl hydrolase [Burkholderiales bacterium]
MFVLFLFLLSTNRLNETYIKAIKATVCCRCLNCSNGVDLSFKIQHYSNGGIKHPNPGVNYAVVKVG